MFRLALLLVFFTIRLAQADFTAACDAYEAGKFADAKAEFTALAAKELSAALAFNLGCTEVKLGHSAAGLLWFNRALLLDPRQRESLQNLRYLKRKEGVFVFDSGALDDFARMLRPQTWPMLFWTSFWMLAVGLGVLLVLRPARLWPWITGLSLAFVLMLVSGLGWATRARQTPASELSMVMKEDLSVLNAPAETADALITINAGSLVHPLEVRGPWTYLELPGESGTRGWLPTATLEKLWPYPEAQALIE